MEGGGEKPLCVCAHVCACLHLFMFSCGCPVHKIGLFPPLISPLLLFIYFLRLDFPLRLMLDNLAGLASSRAPESTFPSLPVLGLQRHTLYLCMWMFESKLRSSCSHSRTRSQLSCLPVHSVYFCSHLFFLVFLKPQAPNTLGTKARSC